MLSPSPLAFTLAPRDSSLHNKRFDPSLDAFHARFKGLCDILLDDPEMFGYCYTQLTDVWPEENGIYTFDRQPKFDNALLRAVQLRKAACEETE